jgi:uncharacterized membrane protein
VGLKSLNVYVPVLVVTGSEVSGTIIMTVHTSVVMAHQLSLSFFENMVKLLSYVSVIIIMKAKTVSE